VTLYPLYHPAAALYTPAMLRTLEDDFRRIPELIAESTAPPAQVIQFPPAAAQFSKTPVEQLGLF
jgi:uracil-DNA glycosylase